MDLHFFDPYIFAYKLQDRGWKTQHIIRDLALYTTDWIYYPNIIYDDNISFCILVSEFVLYNNNCILS